MMAAKHKLVKILSAHEVEEKMEMGLCLLCDELFTPDHAMKHKRIRFKVIEMDEEVDMNFSQKPSNLHCSPQNKVPQPSTREEVQGIVENSQPPSFLKSQTQKLTCSRAQS
jgi:hypothetical protein